MLYLLGIIFSKKTLTKSLDERLSVEKSLVVFVITTWIECHGTGDSIVLLVMFRKISGFFNNMSH